MNRPVAIVPTLEQCEWLRRLSGPMDFCQSHAMDRFACHCYLRSGLEPTVELSAFNHRFAPRRECRGMRLRQTRYVPGDTEIVASTRFVRARVVLWQSNGFVTEDMPAPQPAPNPRLKFPVYTGRGDLSLSGIVFVIDEESDVLAMADERRAHVVTLVTDRARIDEFVRSRIAVLPEHLKRWISALKTWEHLPASRLTARARRG